MREPGYYWVKWDGVWRISEYKQGDWYLIGMMVYLHDYDLEDIDERRIQHPDDMYDKNKEE